MQADANTKLPSNTRMQHDRLRRARSLAFWRILMRRASAAADAQAVGWHPI